MVCFTQMLARLYAWGVAVAEGLTPIEVDSQIDCMRVCVRNSTCSSFFFNQRTSSCYLSDRQVLNTTHDAQSEDVKYFVMYPAACPFPNYQYLKRENLCLSLSSDERSWYDAKANCESDGARLVKIDTEEKNKAVMASIKRSSASRHYFNIGASAPYGNSTWFWTDGSVVENVEWKNTCAYGTEQFFAMIDTDGWCKRNNDISKYICEKVIAG